MNKYEIIHSKKLFIHLTNLFLPMASYESVSRDVDVDEHHTYTQVQIILQTNRQQVSDKQQYVEYEKVSDQGPV